MFYIRDTARVSDESLLYFVAFALAHRKASYPNPVSVLLGVKSFLNEISRKIT